MNFNRMASFTEYAHPRHNICVEARQDKKEFSQLLRPDF